MSWQKMSDQDKRDYLRTQMAEIERGRALLRRFEKVTQKWLKKVEAKKQQAPGEKSKRK
jgi:hypothetical protein